MKKETNSNRNSLQLKALLLLLGMWLSVQVSLAQNAAQPKRTGEIIKISPEQLRAQPPEHTAQKSKPAVITNQQQTSPMPLNFKQTELNESKPAPAPHTEASKPTGRTNSTAFVPPASKVKKSNMENSEGVFYQPKEAILK